MKYCTIVWMDEDVRTREIELQNPPWPPLTDTEVECVLDYMETNHDANYGINWDTVDDAIKVIVEQRGKND